ncbi:MAG: hypothetical protein GY749_12185 [Desulfobacteraceae bacterium]|nr:hypothetical protein [Desulfobacteraceae bacterium]MCP4343952.1 hypothetical protein [Desulfobacterales bacterium]
MIIIEIKNPQEVAKRESTLAKALCRLAPNLISRKVEERVAEQIKNSLSERGIEISVSIRSPEE